MTLTVTIDSREQSRIQSAKTYYEKQGLEVKIAELEIGDYIFTNNKGKAVFEYKTINDFISSIQSGRVFNQAINMSENYDHHYVIIQGTEADRAKAIGMSHNYQPVTIFQYLGAISSLNRFTTVIESYNRYVEEAYYRMLITAKKTLSDKPIVKKFPKKNKNAAKNYLTYCVYGLNGKRATDIVNTLNLNTLEDLLYLDHNKLTRVEGIGSKLADKIITSIQSETYD